MARTPAEEIQQGWAEALGDAMLDVSDGLDEELTAVARTYAKSGDHMRSITTDVQGDAINVYSDVPYANWLEFGKDSPHRLKLFRAMVSRWAEIARERRRG